ALLSREAVKPRWQEAREARPRRELAARGLAGREATASESSGCSGRTASGGWASRRATSSSCSRSMVGAVGSCRRGTSATRGRTMTGCGSSSMTKTRRRRTSD
ncbi:hypothetical protein KEM52_001042, partial [Ascosphaera acerosa]